MGVAREAKRLECCGFRGGRDSCITCQAPIYDDERFARAYVRDKLLYSHWGRRKISLGLYAKRIDRDTIEDALDEIDTKEYEGILLAFLQSRVRSIKEGNTYEGRTKLYRAGVARGFEPETVARLIKVVKWP